MKHLMLLALFVACHTPSPAEHYPEAPVAPPPVAPADPHEGLVTSLVGVWSGTAEGTPLGDFRFALDFVRQPDGSVHTRLNNGPDMYLDFLFHKRDGAWLLTEEGAIPQLGVQKHTLVAAPTGDWADGDLHVALAITGDAMVWTTTMHGKPHAVFHLQKAHGPAVEQIRQAIAQGPK
jgi:hypothetical protein